MKHIPCQKLLTYEEVSGTRQKYDLLADANR